MTAEQNPLAELFETTARHILYAFGNALFSIKLEATEEADEELHYSELNYVRYVADEFGTDVSKVFEEPTGIYLIFEDKRHFVKQTGGACKAREIIMGKVTKVTLKEIQVVGMVQSLSGHAMFLSSFHKLIARLNRLHSDRIKVNSALYNAGIDVKKLFQ